jgi:hypothetical protein
MLANFPAEWRPACLAREENGRMSAKATFERKATKPEAIAVAVESIPLPLRQRRQWVCWQFRRLNDKWTKVPVDAETARNASTTDPQTWSEFDTAWQRYTAFRHVTDGLGFVFAPDDPFVGIDLDDARNLETGELEAWALEIVEAIDSYTEISPSGTGVHIFATGFKLGKGCKADKNGAKVEMYGAGRYFCVTGQQLPGTPANVEDRQPNLTALYQKIFSVNGRADRSKDDFARLCDLIRAGATQEDAWQRVRGDSKFAERGRDYFERTWEAAQRNCGQDKGKQQAGPTMTATALLDADLKDAPCVVAGIIPEGMSILAGKPKLGKSWLALALGLNVALGRQALDRLEAQCGDVLYLALEDTKKRLRGRLRKLLPHGEKPDRLHFQTAWPRQDQGGHEAIEKWLTEHPETRLVIIDTWPKFRSGRGRSQDVYEVDYQHSAEVKALADKHQIAILIVCHCRKLAADDPLDSVSGTLGLTGCADAVLVLKRERGQHDAALFVTGRDIDEQELALRWNKEEARWSLLGEADEYRISRERAKVIEVLKQAKCCMAPSAVAPLLGKATAATKMLLWRMHQDGWLDVEDGKYGIRQND